MSTVNFPKRRATRDSQIMVMITQQLASKRRAPTLPIAFQMTVSIPQCLPHTASMALDSGYVALPDSQNLNAKLNMPAITGSRAWLMGAPANRTNQELCQTTLSSNKLHPMA